MALTNKAAELTCMDPENYKNFFRTLCWNGTRKPERRSLRKISKKEKLRRLKGGNALTICYAPALLSNPSHFAVYSAVRQAILSRWRHLHTSFSEIIDSDSENDDAALQIPISKLPKITSIGLRTVFTMISQVRHTDKEFCENALKALLDILQGHAPEELAQEPCEMIYNLHQMLLDVATDCSVTDAPDNAANLTASLSSSCLLALSVARGEAELILTAIAALIMTPTLLDQNIQIPSNLTILQRSVQSVILGSPSRNQWLHYGVPHQALVNSFPVELPAQLTQWSSELIIRSMASDGCYLYIYTYKGMVKLGSGQGSSIRQHVYLYKPDFFVYDRHGWIGFCKNKLFLRLGRKKTDTYEVDKDTHEVKNVIRFDQGASSAVEGTSAIFSDGNQLGLITITTKENLTVKLYDVDTLSDCFTTAITTLVPKRELNVHLLRRQTLVLGRASYEDTQSRRTLEYDTPVAIQLDDNDDDPLCSICAGLDFGLLTTSSGKVYYTGKGASLGLKSATPQSGRWNLIKDTQFQKIESPTSKKSRIIQVAVGHEGVHAIFVLDNGKALFTGVARRGEDGDSSKHRRTPKPTRPKIILRAEDHHIVYAACNYGSTALVTKEGLLLMFGKDTQHCDSTGVVTALRREKIIQVALGKAHAVALTSFGYVYTFGINNKGQCGREFGYTKEKPYSGRRQNARENNRCVHKFKTDYCRVCVLCFECTGFSRGCRCAKLPNRIPGELCGCGEGDSGCDNCGICRSCVEMMPPISRDRPFEIDEEGDTSRSNEGIEKESGKYGQCEGQSVCFDSDREAGIKVTSLPPARIALPGGHRVVAVACGLHHTVLLTENGEVLTFGSNQYGQLGAGDVSVHHRIVRVRVPPAGAVAAGSNHTAVLSREGEIFTWGSYQKGSLGRVRTEGPSAHSERCPIWYATPARVPRIGDKYMCRASCISASGDQTFMQVSQALIKPETLYSSTITANSNCIVILPNKPEHTFKCITINKTDGSCNAWTGPEQVDFVNSLACFDPLYDVLWCYQPRLKVMQCYNILVFDAHKLQRCSNDPDNSSTCAEYEFPNYGNMKRLEDFKNLENFEAVFNNEDKRKENIALSNMSILNQELAIPSAPGVQITRMHAAIHFLGCLDSLTYAHDVRLNTLEIKQDNSSQPVMPVKEDFLTVNRFETHGGAWGYSGHSVEAIRFMCDTDIVLGGIGLFGGRGGYTAKVKLYDIGTEGGDQEGDGELLAETDEIVYECAPRDKFPVLFENPIPIMASRWYVAWACINGPSSDCGSSGQAMVISDEIGFQFKTSKKSNNGTDVNAGQIPCLLYNIVSLDQSLPVKHADPNDPVVLLSKNVFRKVTVQCFRALISLLHSSWFTFKERLLDTNGQVPINYEKLALMKLQKRYVYVIRACLRLIRSYINEIFPQNRRKRNSQEYMSYFEPIADVRNLLQKIMAESTPSCTMLKRKQKKNRTQKSCFVQFALEITNSILQEAHETITSCFHAFFPTPTLKWNHLCYLLCHVKCSVLVCLRQKRSSVKPKIADYLPLKLDVQYLPPHTEGEVPSSQIRELTSTCAAMCASRSLRDVLQYVVPFTQICISNETRRNDTKVIKDVKSKSATVPRSSHAQKPPPVPPRANRESQKPTEPEGSKTNYMEWHLLDVIPRLLDIVLIPIKQQMMTLQCGQVHDHGEIKQHERLAEYSCKLIARIVAELSHSASNIKEDQDTSTVTHLVTSSRFMRVNPSRAWNTGSGSPDAISFTVDRPGVMLVGACVFGGLGTYECSLELLHDIQQIRVTAEDTYPVNCWVIMDMVHSSFTAADCQHDIAQIKFDQPVLLKQDVRYAIRLRNHGGRTAHGDCGLPSVKGPDGTTFRFASCSLSYNGTTLARGQIPSLIYYGTSKPYGNSLESADTLLTTLRAITLRVASTVMERTAELFSTLRNELTVEDLQRNSYVLQQSPTINTLIPYTLANLHGLDDSKSVIQILEMVHKLLPHVAAMNLTVPTPEELPTSTTTNHYTWVESDHPYKQSAVTNMRVLFPPSVSWTILEMDPRSMTAQPEDTLTIYAVAGAPKQKCHCANDNKTEPPFKKKIMHLTSEIGEVEDLAEESDCDSPCMHYNCTYVSVTPKLANNPADWPQKALLVPGNEVIFSLETSSDYLAEYNKTNNEDSRFGFRCLCVGYEDTPFTCQRQGLICLEMELVYMGASLAARLLSPDLDIPPLTLLTVVDVQSLEIEGNSPSAGDSDSNKDTTEALFLSRGLVLSSPPSVHQILDGQPLLRCESTERQFLSDFVLGAESTAGGRLARWLAPTPRVEPAKCELKAPNMPLRPGASLSLPIHVRDQYGDSVISPALKIEVVVQRVEHETTSQSGDLTTYARLPSVPEAPYQPVIKESMCFHSITMMKAYQSFSFEELRYASHAWGESHAQGVCREGAPAERLAVRVNRDTGEYFAAWVPRSSGVYRFRCTFDDQPTLQELILDVAETSSEASADSQVVPNVPPARVCRFIGRHSAGLRLRASPSLQAEVVGRVPPRSNVIVVEEVVNKDGSWARLSAESARKYAATSAAVAWCLQHHMLLDRVLLVPLDNSPLPVECTTHAYWGFDELHKEVVPWVVETDPDVAPNDADDRMLAYSTHSDLAYESDGNFSPCLFGAEPSKRTRLMRNEASVSPQRTQRRNNGNSDDWWSASKPQSSDNAQADPVPETEIHSEAESSSSQLSSRLAQTGTQTSPDNDKVDVVFVQTFNETPETPKAGGSRSRPLSKERALPESGSTKPPSPPRAALRAAPAPLQPRKLALSPTQAESLRAVFAALLWHEGIVHDAIACAAFLKFHPQLPKQGARVVTRAPSHDVASPRPQRHSVEVSNAGYYLRIHPSTLETLNRSGAEASASRMRRNNIDSIIREEDHTHNVDTRSPSSSVVNVLPPALRALVALWDTLSDAGHHAANVEVSNQEGIENNENEDPSTSSTRKMKERKSSFNKPSDPICELCGGEVPPPLAIHMRYSHIGCRTRTAWGYNRDGDYVLAEPSGEQPPQIFCGQLSNASNQLWFIYCEICRERSIKVLLRAKQLMRQLSDMGLGYGNESPIVDQYVMKENALFLLDLAPLTNSKSASISPWNDGSERSPPTPPSSMWQPAPPFQCLPALGAEPRASMPIDTAKYHSLGRPPPPPAAPIPYGPVDPHASSQWPRLNRSVSMGQTAGRDLSQAAKPPLATTAHLDTPDTLSGAGSSLLAQPSAALQQLVGCGDSADVSAFESPQVNAEALMQRPVLSFVLAKRDLKAYRQKLDAVVRINTVRQYAFEALNWLLRSATQPTCVHDVMWWLCSALDKFARMVPPAVADDENKEAPNESPRYIASVSTICPGGRSARSGRAAFHALLGTVSALAPSLPSASAAALQAVRCWALNYDQHDRAFLHSNNIALDFVNAADVRSQVFSVISKILSHSEDEMYEDAIAGALYESSHSFLQKENHVWVCPDMTGWCDVSVSSRQGMAGALTDGSTETFWESGDEDRNKAKWIQLSYPGSSVDDRPHIICVHIDNTRDTMNKTLLVSVLYASGSSDFFHMQDLEVDPKVATWVCYTLPKVSSSPVRIRCELRGPEAAVRVRQVRVLSTPAPASATAPVSHSHVLHALIDADTLRVFRLLTSQVFGKLLEWDGNGSDNGGEVVKVDDAAPADDTDLREHVVGILFAGHKLTSLQKQVMSHIVCAIGCEAARARDDWETALLCADGERDGEDDQPRHTSHQDNYCFEMLSLLLALSGSAVGRAHLTQRTELLSDLLALLHTGSERVQRQVISLLRRMIAEIPPQKMLAALNNGSDLSTRITLLDHLVCYVGKAITVQVKVKGGGGGVPASSTLGASVNAGPAVPWFTKGDVIKKHAHLVTKLLTDMAEDKVSPAWGHETRTGVAQYVIAVSQISESDRSPARCIAAPTVWMALAALCICEQGHLDLVKGESRESVGRDSSESRPYCANHDDGVTAAVIECRSCGPLCAECDRFLHLHRAARSHHRQICKEEESAIRIDIHEGCGRAKLFWLLLLVDRRTLKALAEFRSIENGVVEQTAQASTSSGAPVLAGVCRFCGTRSNTGLLAISNVCADHQCQEYGGECCSRVLGCGHQCGGVRGESVCLPCLFGCAGGGGGGAALPLRQDADDMCMICFTDPLQAAPAIQLTCGHVFHLHCCKKVLANKWNGPRITFSFSQCPICKEDMNHWTLDELLTPIRRLQQEVRRKALMRLEYEGLGEAGARGKPSADPANYAMERYAYYVCHKCEKAYFGGLARCEAEWSGTWEPSELACGACSDVAGAGTCPKHGADFLEYKCRYCCSVAVYFCFGTSHFCNSCHDDFQRITNLPKNALPQCPAGPKGEQLPGTAEECPLQVHHPPTGEEFALGCGVCRKGHAF